MIARLDAAATSTARCVSGSSSLGSIATEFAVSLAHTGEPLAAAAAALLESALHDLIAVALRPTPDVRERSRGAARQMMRRAIERHIDTNLADPALGPNSIASRFGVSAYRAAPSICCSRTRTTVA
ncbi:MAG: hypothetical protein LH632_18835 [Rhodoferax sp.]|nr:hypothetical protein [Rhodoferax sp.]